jgi:hypothetical protein
MPVRSHEMAVWLTSCSAAPQICEAHRVQGRYIPAIARTLHDKALAWLSQPAHDDLPDLDLNAIAVRERERESAPQPIRCSTLTRALYAH